MKQYIIPYNELWFDCYTSILYTLLFSDKSELREIIYNNDYEYLLNKEKTSEGKEFYSIIMETFVGDLEKEILLNEKIIKVEDREDEIRIIKQNLNDGKVVLLDIDMYYWLPKFQAIYGINHIYHTGHVIGYTEDRFILNEEGEEEISYNNLYLSSQNAGSNIYIYDRGIYRSEKKIKVELIKKNAYKIINSLEKCIAHEKDVWEIEGFDVKDIDYFAAIAGTHMKSIQNRVRGNTYLFNRIFEDETRGIFFKNMENECEILKNKLLIACMRYDIKKIFEIKSNLFNLLKKECEFWKDISNGYYIDNAL